MDWTDQFLKPGGTTDVTPEDDQGVDDWTSQFSPAGSSEPEEPRIDPSQHPGLLGRGAGTLPLTRNEQGQVNVQDIERRMATPSEAFKAVNWREMFEMPEDLQKIRGQVGELQAAHDRITGDDEKSVQQRERLAQRIKESGEIHSDWKRIAKIDQDLTKMEDVVPIASPEDMDFMRLQVSRLEEARDNVKGDDEKALEQRARIRERIAESRMIVDEWERIYQVAADKGISPEAAIMSETIGGRMMEKAPQIFRRGVSGALAAGEAAYSYADRLGYADIDGLSPTIIALNANLRNEYNAALDDRSKLAELVGPRLSNIIGSVSESLPKVMVAGKAGGMKTILGLIGMERFSTALSEYELEQGDAPGKFVYAGLQAGTEVGITALLGHIAGRVGIQTMEEVFSAPMRSAGRTVATSPGVKGAVTKFFNFLRGANFEGGEELIIAGLDEYWANTHEVRDPNTHLADALIDAYTAGAIGQVASRAIQATTQRIAGDTAEQVIPPPELVDAANEVQTEVNKALGGMDQKIEGIKAAEELIAQLSPSDPVHRVAKDVIPVKEPARPLTEFVRRAREVRGVPDSPVSNESEFVSRLAEVETPADLNKLIEDVRKGKVAEVETPPPFSDSMIADLLASEEGALKFRDQSQEFVDGLKETLGGFVEAYKNTVESQHVGDGDVAPESFTETIPYSRKLTSVDPRASFEDAGTIQFTQTGVAVPFTRIGTSAALGAIAGFGAAGIPGAVAVGTIAAAAKAYTSLRGKEALATSRSLLESLADQAASMPAQVRPNAVAMSNTMTERGLNVMRTVGELTGQFSELRTRLLKTTGSPLFPSVEAQRINRMEMFQTEDGTERGYGYTKVSDAITGNLEVDGPLKQWVDAQAQLQDQFARMAEEQRQVQRVPFKQQEARRAILDAMLEDDVNNLYKDVILRSRFRKKLKGMTEEQQDALLNKHLPEDAEIAREILTQVQRFEAQGDGHVRIRVATDTMRQIMQSGEGHKLFQPFVEAVSHANDIEISAVRNAIVQDSEGNFRQTYTEIPRIFENMPDFLIVDGQRIDLLESNPFNYSAKVMDTFTNRFANIEEFSQSLTEPGMKAQQDVLSDRAKELGLNQTNVDSYFDALSGMTQDKSLGGIEPHSADGAVRPLVQAFKALQLSHSFAVQYGEWMGNIGAYGGWKQGLESLQAFLPKNMQSPRFRDAMELVEREGMAKIDYANWSFDPSNLSETISRNYSNIILAMTKHAWNAQQRQAAFVGMRWAEQMKSRAGENPSDFDTHTLRHVLGYSRQQAEYLSSGKGSDAEYRDVVRRFAQNTNTTVMSHGLDESPIMNVDLWRKGMWYSRYSLMQARSNERAVNGMIDPLVQAWRNPTDANRREAAIGVHSFAKRLGGLTAAGAVSLLIKNMLQYGPSAGFSLTWDLMEDDPTKFGAQAFGMVTMGPLWGWFAYGAQQDRSTEEAIAGAIPAAQPVMDLIQTSRDIANPANAQWPNKDLSRVEMASEFVKRMTMGRIPGTIQTQLAEFDAAAHTMALMGIGLPDKELDASVKFLNEWRRREGLPDFSGFEGRTEQDFVDFRNTMKEFTSSLRQKVDTPAEAEKRVNLIEKALESPIGDKQRIIRSLNARRLVTRLPEDHFGRNIRQEFADKYPDRFRKLEAYDVLIMEMVEALKRMK
jgi:hypothetical protein